MPKIKKIAIAGAGGIGGFVVQYLYDFGAMRNQFPITDYNIDLYDNDTVDEKNLLHQNYTLDDLGKQKAQILSERYSELFTPVLEFMTPDQFKKYDVIFSCVDSMTFRKSLYEYSWEHPNKVFWIDGRCSSRMGAVFNSNVDKEMLQRYINDSKEREGCLLKFEKENNISHAMPIVISGLMVQTFLNYTRDEKTVERILRV